jgi:hypothetical protein
LKRAGATSHHYGADLRCSECGLGFALRDEQCEPADAERRAARLRYAQEHEAATTRRAELCAEWAARERSARPESSCRRG